MFKLTAKKRESGKGLENLKAEGMIPAVFYGFKRETTPIAVSLKDFRKIWREAGESSAIVLETEAGPVDVLIHDMQTDPISDTPIHVDFLAIDMTKKITVAVPVEFEGEAPIVKGGTVTLVKVLHEVEVEALPKDLPHSLSVDVSAMDALDSQVLVKDIELPSGVTLITGADEVVASISEQKEEVEEVAPVSIADIELSEKKGKKDEEGGEAVAEESKE